MKAKVMLFSNNCEILNDFLNKFYTDGQYDNTNTTWHKEFSNPIEISEFIAAFVDNINYSNLTMWITLDEDVFIKISNKNSNSIIKYLFERYPY